MHHETAGSIDDLVRSAVGVEKVDVPLKGFTVTEGSVDGVHQLLLRVGQAERVFRIDRWKVCVQHRMFDAVDNINALFKVDFFEHIAVVHRELGIAVQQLAFQLELNDRDRLMHLGGELFIDKGIDIFVQQLRHETLTWVISVNFGGERRELA